MKTALRAIVLLMSITAAGHWAEAAVLPLLDLSGRQVTSVTWDEGSLSGSEFEQLATVSPGRELVPVEVRQSILNLYRTGLFKQVTVTAEETGEGVALHFELTPRRWLESVAFQGNLGLGSSELMRVLNLGLKQEVDEDRLADNVGRIMDHYAYRGYEQTEVGYRVEADKRQHARVVFTILEGPRDVIGDIRLAGDHGFSRFAFLMKISSAIGEEFDRRRLDRDLKKIKNSLGEQGHFYPAVSYEAAPDSADPTVKIVTFTITRGERFVFTVSGVAGKDAKRIRKWLAESYRQARSEQEARRAVEKRIREWYVNHGYPFASVAWEEARVESGVRQVTVSVVRGDLAVISGILMEGSDHFDVSRLTGIIGLQKGSPFVRTEVDKALEDLEEAYHRDGYLDVDASLAPLDFLSAGEQRQVAVRIQVKEGERTVVGALTSQGGPYDDDDLRDILQVAVGDPYVPEDIREGRERLLARLGSDGYLYSSVTVDEPVRSGAGVVELVIRVEPGPQVRLGRIIINGNEEVDSRIIRLALDLEEGQLLDLQEIIEAQERVYRLGVMDSVTINLADRETPAPSKDILVNVVERNRYVINLRVGYGNEDRLRTEVTATNRNVARMARTLTLGTRASSIENRTSLTYGHPWFLSRPIDFTVSIIDLVEHRESYSRDSVSVLADLTREVSQYTTTRLAYRFEGLRLFDVSPDAQLSPEDEGQTDVASLVPELLFDSRDDFLEPARGILADFRLEVADTALGSAAEFYKVEISGRWYKSIFNRSVLASLLRLGYVRSYGGSDEVIISKRFFLGGQNSVRGYALDSLGPRDSSGDPIGGNYLLNANLELRYPILGTFGGVLFVDSGSVWLRDASGSEGFKLRVASGTGLRWSSPIGPLSLDYAAKLNPAPVDEDDRYRWHFSIGHAF